MLEAPAAVSELVDEHGSEPCVRKDVEVRILSAALTLVLTAHRLPA